MSSQRLSLKSLHSVRTHKPISSYYDEGDEGDEGDEDRYLPSSLSQHIMRTQLLLLDYKQFKAARTIQKMYRGWSVRNILKKRHHAATVIQRAWQRSVYRRHLTILIQNHTQEKILIMFNKKSVKIQALFRGWWSRKHINNMCYLKEMQMNCIKDILFDYALKLHSLKRKGMLPGYYDTCDSQCRHKVDAFLSSISYRFYNRYMGNKYLTVKSFLDNQRRHFLDCAFWTSVPYAGFNHNSACNPVKNFEVVTKVYGLHEYDVAQAFLSGTRPNNTIRRTAKPIELKRHPRKPGLCLNEKRFCNELFNSMKHWHFCSDCKLSIPDDWQKINLEDFINEVKHQMEEQGIMINCNCERDEIVGDPLKPCH